MPRFALTSKTTTPSDATSGTPAVSGAYIPPVGRRWLAAILAALLGFRLVFHIGSGPFGDEAYYWLWGQHLALSYFDHPGLNAWFLGLFSWLGWSPAILRLGGLLTTAGTILFFAYWARRLAGPAWIDYLLAAAVIWLASPLVFYFGVLAFSDHWLIFFSLLAVHFFVLFFLGVESGRSRLRLLYTAAILLGIAGLAKYIAVLIAVAVAATVLSRPRLRHLIASPHLYLGALVALAIQAPTIAWNVANDSASFRFHFGRLEGAFNEASLTNAAAFVIIGVLLLSPTLVQPFFAFFRRRTGLAGADLWRWVGLTLFVISTAIFLVLSLRVWVHIYWNILAFVLFYPLAPLYLRSRPLFIAHSAIGLAFAAGLAANYVITPLAPLVGASNPDSAAVYGWEEISARAIAAEQRLRASLVAGSGFLLTAQFGFALRRADVVCVSTNCNQFDLWRDPDRLGRDAILLTLDRQPAAAVAAHFDELQLIETIPIIRIGRTIETYRLYYAIGYREAPAPP